MIERCSDRQRKDDGLERSPFHLFVESLSIMLQIALLLLTCGLPRYMWSVNTPVARVIISFTVLGMLFYIGIVVAGTSSYVCPFQTPASMTPRSLQDNGKTLLLASLSSPLKIVFFIRFAWRVLLRRAHRVRNVMVNPPSWGISFSNIFSGVRNTSRRVGHRTIVLLLRADRTFRNARQMLVQGVRRHTSTPFFPTSGNGTSRQIQTPRVGILVSVSDLPALLDRNAGNTRCVGWIIRSITDPEAINSALRLAGSIRWFDRNVDVDPPFDFIVSTFEACLDSTKSPYPGMGDRAYFSGRAILQIKAVARFRSKECASKYPIPYGFFSLVGRVNRNLYQILRLCWSGTQGVPINSFFVEGIPAHLLWMSSLFVDMAREDPTSLTEISLSKANGTSTSRPAVDANILLAWCIHLGGQVEEETFWAEDKSCVVVPSWLIWVT